MFRFFDFAQNDESAIGQLYPPLAGYILPIGKVISTFGGLYRRYATVKDIYLYLDSSTSLRMTRLKCNFVILSTFSKSHANAESVIILSFTTLGATAEIGVIFALARATSGERTTRT